MKGFKSVGVVLFLLVAYFSIFTTNGSVDNGSHLVSVPSSNVCGRLFQPLPAWAERPTLPKSRCVIIPAHRPAFTDLRMLLRTVAERAVDTVTMYLVLSNSEEIKQWQEGHDASLAPTTILDVQELAKALSVGWSSELATAIEEAKDYRLWGHLKKALGILRAGELGCKVAWVIDAESFPMRVFSFASIITSANLHAVFGRDVDRGLPGTRGLYARRKGAVHENENIVRPFHNRALSPMVGSMNFRQNDFWLYEPSLFAQMLQETVRGRGLGRVNNWTILDTLMLLRGGTFHNSVYAWLADGIVTRRPELKAYQLVSLADTDEALDTCAPPSWSAAHKHTVFGGDPMWKNIQEFDFECVGRVWRQDLRQAGFWGEYVRGMWSFKDSYYLRNGTHVAGMIRWVPWCNSNCMFTHVLPVIKRAESIFLDQAREECMAGETQEWIL